jgi:hypothetical protein
VYSNTSVNIAATAARDEDEGFLHTRLPAIRIIELNERLDNSSIIDWKHSLWMRPTLNRDISESALSKRAWCYQESVLSPRTLYYGHLSIFFSCREQEDYEVGPKPIPIGMLFRVSRAPSFYKTVSRNSRTPRTEERHMSYGGEV